MMISLALAVESPSLIACTEMDFVFCSSIFFRDLNHLLKREWIYNQPAKGLATLCVTPFTFIMERDFPS